jgi:YidC/Oxa1 family membrane protein insertase
MSNNKNLILAFALSALVLFVWQYFVAKPQMQAEQAKQTSLSSQQEAETPAPKPASAAQAPNAPTAPDLSGTGAGKMTRAAALKAGGPRVMVNTPMVGGSILLKGARFDDLRLKKYHQTVDPKSPQIVLLAPRGAEYPYYAEFGWVGANGVPKTALPDDNSQWQQVGQGALTPDHPVTLRWSNGRGLVFTRTISVDDKYMFTVTDKVANDSTQAVTLYPYGYVARQNVPKTPHSYLLHEGFVGVADGSEVDAKYSDFEDKGTPPKTFASTGGWVGITDKYWMAAVVPPQSAKFTGAYLGSHTSGGEGYQANYRLGPHTVTPGGQVMVKQQLFAGAKVVDILNAYENQGGIAHFDKAVDWGWFWFFTKPIFWLVDLFYKFIGNFGVAILMLTVVIKLAFFPLANAQYKSMSKMKKVQPEMERLKKAHADDSQLMQQKIMEMYKREKVNPLAGCLPVVIQIPVFFALYKVLYVTIEMRHAPFFGWIQDLSAPDPTSIINLFGLLPFNPHLIVPAAVSFLSIGIWPILMGCTQWFQMKLNPTPADPIQARMFTFMPVIFTFMFATFPAGLVIYYTWNNLLSAGQQYFIMRRQGVEVKFFDRPKKLKAANE